MSEQTTNSQEQGKDAAKVLKNFENTILKLTAIVGGKDKLVSKKKVKKSAMEELVTELFKEDSEAVKVEVKEGLRNLLKGFVVLNSTLTAERKKLDALEIAKKKEFIATATQLFAKIDNVDSILHDYTNAMAAAGEGVITGTEEKTTTEEVEE